MRIPAVHRAALVAAALSLGGELAAAADIEVTGIDFEYHRRAAGGWEPADAAAVGNMVAVHCNYRVTGRARGGPPADWSLAFMHGDEELARAAGAGLTDPRTGASSRTWYGTLLAAGPQEIACVADADDDIDEADESNNRRARTLNVPAPANARTSAPRSPVFGNVTPRQAAAARGAPPAIDLAFTDFAGIDRVGDSRDPAAPAGPAAARAGDRLALNCSYRAFVGGPNGEVARVPAWRVAVEGAGAEPADTAGQREFVSVDGASPPGRVVHRWTPDTPGRRNLRCVLDPDNVVAETDENNNLLELTVDVAAQDAGTGARPGAAAATLAFMALESGSLQEVMGPGEIDIYRDGLKIKLLFESAVAAQFNWRWQVSLWPFPANPDEPPQALLADGVAKPSSFFVNFGSFPPLGKAAPARQLNLPSAAARDSTRATAAGQAPVGTQPASGELPPAVDRAPGPGQARAQAGNAAPAGVAVAPGTVPPDVPVDFYIRIRPYAGGKPAGPPSNVVVAHYLPGKNPISEEVEAAFAAQAAQEKELAEMTAAANVYQLQLEGFTQPIFPDPARWGCVIVLSNPYAGMLHPYGKYKPDGKTVYCPPKDPSKQQKDWDEQILQGLEGFGKAWDGLAWVYDVGKNWVAEQFAEHVPCEWLGDLEADCESAAKSIAGTAISVGLAAAGVPPTLPDLEGLGNLAKGEAVEAAVDYTCQAIESEGGACTPEIRDGLAELYGEGLDQMQSAAAQEIQEPNCGDMQTAKELGLLPLPCFSVAGIDVKAAPGAVEEPPAARVRVTRIAKDPAFPMDCRISLYLLIENHVEQNKEATKAHLWPSASVPVPPLSLNSSKAVDLVLGPRQPFAKAHQSGPTADWPQLLKGATGKLGTGAQTGAAVAPGPQGPVTVPCGDGLLYTVKVPGTLGMESKWTVQPAN